MRNILLFVIWAELFQREKITAQFITCSNPGNVENASTNFTDRVVSGSQIIYKCATDFQHTTGDTRRTCQVNGTWSGAPMVCRPTAPTILLKSTNDTIIINATSPKDRRVNGLHVAYFDQKSGTRRNKTFYGTYEHRVLDGLHSGSCYNLTFYFLIGNFISFATTKKYCTVPNPPLLVEVLACYNSSILISITNGSGNLDNYNIEINSVQFIQTTYTTVDINDLQAGYVYDIQVRAQANGLISTSFNIQQATYPDIPRLLHTINQTTDTITVDVYHGKGLVQSFHIKVNDSYQLYSPAFFGINITRIVIPRLIPGTFYKNITIQAVSNNLTSSSANLMPHSTNPDIPRLLHIINQTTDTITVDVYHGKGLVQSFDIKVNDSYQLYSPALSDTNITPIVIPYLIPGTFYQNMTIKAVSNNLTSSIANLMPHSTNPDIPRLLRIINQTTDTITVAVYHGKGLVQSFDIKVNDSYQLHSPALCDNNIDLIVIPYLIPGTFYKNITIQAVSNNLTSSSTSLMPHSTNPDIPRLLRIINQTIDTITVAVYHGKGLVQSFDIKVNDSYQLYSPALSDNNITPIVIPYLIPGTFYKTITIQAVSNNLTSSIASLMPHSTNPDIPKLLHITNQTTDTITVDVYHGKGLVKSFDIKVNDSYQLYSPALPDNNITPIVIPYLIPGTLYKNITIQAVSNNLTSSIANLMPHSTNPPVPYFSILEHSNNQVNMTVGIRDGYVEKYEAAFTNVNKSTNCGSDYQTTVIAGSSNIDKLTAGTKYIVSVKSVSHSLTSISTSQTIITNPSSPAVNVIDLSVNSISISITKGSGCVHHYDIYVNGKKRTSVVASSETVKFVLDNLHDGITYQVYAISVSYGQRNSLQPSSSVSTSTLSKPLCNNVILLVAVICSIFGTVIIMSIGFFIHKWYFKRYDKAGKNTKANGRLEWPSVAASLTRKTLTRCRLFLLTERKLSSYTLP